MHTMIKAMLTAGIVVALVWPLLFWGKSESSENYGRNIQRNNPRQAPQAPFVFTPQYEPGW
jgi:hypothetical protein